MFWLSGIILAAIIRWKSYGSHRAMGKSGSGLGSDLGTKQGRAC